MTLPADAGIVTLWGASGADFDTTGVYRYRLWREWDDALPSLLWVMLNPSTADAERNDPTVGRCCTFSRRWGYGGLIVCNLFAIRSAYPEILYAEDDPIGPDNDAAILRAAGECPETVLAWGNHGRYQDRAAAVLRVLRGTPTRLRCLGTTGKGCPKHPLYLASDTPMRPW